MIREHGKHNDSIVWVLYEDMRINISVLHVCTIASIVCHMRDPCQFKYAPWSYMYYTYSSVSQWLDLIISMAWIIDDSMCFHTQYLNCTCCIS